MQISQFNPFSILYLPSSSTLYLHPTLFFYSIRSSSVLSIPLGFLNLSPHSFPLLHSTPVVAPRSTSRCFPATFEASNSITRLQIRFQFQKSLNLSRWQRRIQPWRRRMRARRRRAVSFCSAALLPGTSLEDAKVSKATCSLPLA